MSYQSPKMRGETPPMADDAPMPAMDEGKEPDYVSGFLPKEVFGETPPKVGEKVTFEVKAVDPDTGEAEVVCSHDGDEEESEGAMAAMDKLPTDEEE